LPDVSDKLSNIEDSLVETEDFKSKRQEEIQIKKRVIKKKTKGKGK
jgi:uncharacterized protein YfkK (UPF0435 family)